jgi:hypothetical protein
MPRHDLHDGKKVMGKVIESKGLTEFVQNGTVTHVPDHKPGKPNEAPKLEVKEAAPVVDLGEKTTEKSSEKPPEVDKALEKAIETEENVPTLSEESRKYVNKQHRLRKEAQEEAELSEALAREQYNRAMLAEEKAKSLELELSQLKKPQEAAKVEELKFPMAQDFVKDGTFNQDDYQKAVTEYNKAQTQKILDEERAARDRAQVEARLAKSADEARKAHTDFDDVMASVKGTPADLVPQFVLTYITESDHSGEIAYHLAKNPEEAQRIAKLSPIRGIAELGKLEAKITTKEAPKTEPLVEKTGAPPPITPISTAGAGTVNTDPSRMSFAELRAYEREKRRKK